MTLKELNEQLTPERIIELVYSLGGTTHIENYIIIKIPNFLLVIHIAANPLIFLVFLKDDTIY